MPIRVGITTDPKARKVAWEKKVVGLKNWRVLASYKNKEDAQKRETGYAKRNKCHSSPNGAKGNGPWHVYRFDYTRRK
jgi:hypothetical protein